MTMPMGATGSRSGNKMTGNKLRGDIIPKGYRMGQLQNFTPEMMELFQQWMSQLGPQSFTSKLAGGDQSMFEEMEAPAMKQFQGMLGDISSRFSGMGMGSRRSSGFQNLTNQASMDFAEKLHSQRLGLRQQAIRDLSDMSNSLLSQRPYEKNLIKKDLPYWKQMLLGINETAKELAPTAAKYAMGGF